MFGPGGRIREEQRHRATVPSDREVTMRRAKYEGAQENKGLNGGYLSKIKKRLGLTASARKRSICNFKFAMRKPARHRNSSRCRGKKTRVDTVG
jgi:hypothetical protein